MEGMISSLEAFVQLLVGGIGTLATGIGKGITDLVVNMFFTTSTAGAVTGLSTFAGVLAIFGGISLAIGLSTKIFNMLKNRG